MINGKNFNCLFDSGSPVSFIDISLLRSNFSSTQQEATFSTVSGSVFRSLGKCTLDVSFQDLHKPISFYVVRSPMQLILGVDGLSALNVTLSFTNRQNDIGCIDHSVPKNRKDFLKLFTFSSEICNENLTRLQDILCKFNDVFSTAEYDLGRTDRTFHSIETGNTAPIHSRLFRLPHSQKLTASKQIQNMLKNDIIEEANSPWNSPFFFVKKKDGSDRFVVDFRSLNSETVKDRMPIPNIEELLDNLSESLVFSSIDLASGY